MKTTCMSSLRRLLAFAVAFPVIMFAGDQKPDSAVFVAALKQARIRAGGPFTLKAHFKALELAGQPEGTYQVEWRDAANWHDVIDMPGYHEERGAIEGHTWRKRPIGFTPKPALEVQAATDLNDFGWTANEQWTVEKIRKDKVVGQNAWCAYVSLRQVSPSLICIERQDGRVLSVGWWELYDWKDFGNRQYPAKFVLREDKLISLTLYIDEVAPLTFEGTLHYMPLDGSVAFPYCTGKEYVPARIEKKVPPHYPESARQNHREGKVVSEITVDETGQIKRVVIIGSAGSDLDQATAEALPKWRYTAAMCDGKAIAQEVEVRTFYSRRP